MKFVVPLHVQNDLGNNTAGQVNVDALSEERCLSARTYFGSRVRVKLVCSDIDLEYNHVSDQRDPSRSANQIEQRTTSDIHCL